MKQRITYVNGMPFKREANFKLDETELAEAVERLDCAIRLYKKPETVLRTNEEGFFYDDYKRLCHNARLNITTYLEYGSLFRRLITDKKLVARYVDFETQLTQDKKDLANKIADFFIALGNGEIKSFSSLMKAYPVIHFNERRGSSWAELYEKFGGTQDNAWARLYQLFGIEPGMARRATYIIRGLSESALEKIITDTTFGVPKEKIEELKKLKEQKKIGPGTGDYSVIHDFIKESTSSSLLEGPLLNIFENGVLSQEKVDEFARDRASRLSNTAFSIGLRDGAAATEDEIIAIINYMNDNDIPLINTVFNGLTRDYLLGDLELPQEYKGLIAMSKDSPEGVKKRNRIPIEGRNTEPKVWISVEGENAESKDGKGNKKIKVYPKTTPKWRPNKRSRKYYGRSEWLI